MLVIYRKLAAPLRNKRRQNRPPLNYLARDARAAEDLQGMLLVFLPPAPKQLLGIRGKRAECESVRRLQRSPHAVYFLLHQIMFWLGDVVQVGFFFPFDREVPELYNIHQLVFFFPNCVKLEEKKKGIIEQKTLIHDISGMLEFPFTSVGFDSNSNSFNLG